MAIINRQSRAQDAPDLYMVLGLHPTATLEQIKAAFRRQALRYHPDKNSGSHSAAEQFKLCNEAYAVLSDPGRRARYDWEREDLGVQEIARGILDDLLGTRRRRRQAGRDLHYRLEVTFREAALGLQRAIRFPVPERCPACSGSGAAAGGTRPCPSCGGKGESRERLGVLVLPRPCPRCGGQGISVVTACAGCGATGTLEKIREYGVRLEPGIEDGTVKVVPGRGEPGRGGAPDGDLRILVKVAADPLITVDGSDLRVAAPLRFSVAVLGGTVEVPTLEGRARMRIPPGTQSGRVFRLAGKGLPRGRRRGDLLVRVELETPVKVGEEAERQLKAFDSACSEGAHPRVREFLEQLEGCGQADAGAAMSRKGATGSAPCAGGKSS